MYETGRRYRCGNFRKLPADDGHWWNAYPSSRFVVRSKRGSFWGGGSGEASSRVIRSDPTRSSDDEDMIASPMATSWIAQYRDSKSLRLSHLLPGISVGRSRDPGIFEAQSRVKMRLQGISDCAYRLRILNARELRLSRSNGFIFVSRSTEAKFLAEN